MLAEDIRFEGFDAPAWLNLLSLFAKRTVSVARDDLGAPTARGTLVVVLDDAGKPCASFATDRGPIALEPFDPATELEAVCARHGVAAAVLLQEGAIEELTERAADLVLAAPDYVAQWLALLTVARQLEDEKLLWFWPPRGRMRLPSPAVLRRALDLLLPDDHVALFALWDGPELWTACALQRSGGQLSACIGPDRLLSWAGPLSGDYRRDQRALQRAVSRALAPVHIGLFAQRERIEQLLADPNPGAWARAFALREVIIDPAPAYVHVAVGADAARAASRRASAWLGGLDLISYVAPAGQYVRDHVSRVGSVSNILGFNPLQALASRLRRK
ncbi:MAG TPA: hypothetical protein VK509_13960 [Polyangiales bacterium]|nr:hypothetical protein [Polyangiales bacterium]